MCVHYRRGAREVVAPATLVCTGELLQSIRRYGDLIRRWLLTRIDVRGADRHHLGADGHVLQHLVRVAHRIEDGRIVVQVQHIAVDG